MMIVKILALSNSKIYFIYFTTSLYNTPKHPTSMILFFFFNTSFKYSIFILSLLFFILSLSLCLSFSKVYTKINHSVIAKTTTTTKTSTSTTNNPHITTQPQPPTTTQPKKKKTHHCQIRTTTARSTHKQVTIIARSTKPIAQPL